MDNTQKQQVIEKLKNSTNVLVAVSQNPSVDQLSASIGLTLMLNGINKHATAVYGGQTPRAVDFLEPSSVIRQDTDSLQDFIIALDRSKADKLRYKKEDDVVKIFITPYRTSLSEADLDFSHGDFNVDVVITLGVDQREHLDQAITAHGSILHDAPVLSLMAGTTPSELGSVNWQDPNASSLCEMVAEMTENLGAVLDNQIATALLTGIVSETERFKNEKTSPRTMTVSASLMAVGANQRLVADNISDSMNPDQAVGDGADSGSSQAGAEDAEVAESEDVTPEEEAPIAEQPVDESEAPQELQEAQPLAKLRQRPLSPEDQIEVNETSQDALDENSGPKEISIDADGKLITAEDRAADQAIEDAEIASGPVLPKPVANAAGELLPPSKKDETRHKVIEPLPADYETGPDLPTPPSTPEFNPQPVDEPVVAEPSSQSLLPQQPQPDQDDKQQLENQAMAQIESAYVEDLPNTQPAPPQAWNAQFVHLDEPGEQSVVMQDPNPAQDNTPIAPVPQPESGLDPNRQSDSDQPPQGPPDMPPPPLPPS